MIFLRLSEGIFGFGAGGVNRVEEVDNRYGESIYRTALFFNNTKLSAVKESIEEIQKLLDNASEKKDT
jgi:hypothetical protein